MAKKSIKKVLKAVCGSDKTPLKLGNTEIPCYVLEDGTRVLSGRGLQKSLGYEGDTGGWLKNFITSKSIEPYLSSEILTGFANPIKFHRNNAGGSQTVTYGYEATSLIDLCDALMTLKNTGKLRRSHLIYADQAEMIIRSVAKVGIIALVDEVTGYQSQREANELQKILKAYIAEELLKWQKTFPDAFYREIFRLNKWDYTVKGIQKRPGVVGKWTNKYIYEQLPKGVLEELKSNTPKSAAGNYTARFFQGLTVDTGHAHLNNQLIQVMALMRASGSWEEFESLFDRMTRRDNGEEELPFEAA